MFAWTSTIFSYPTFHAQTDFAIISSGEKVLSRALSEIVPDVKVDNVLQIGALDADGEGVRRVEGERHQPSSLKSIIWYLSGMVVLPC